MGSYWLKSARVGTVVIGWIARSICVSLALGLWRTKHTGSATRQVALFLVACRAVRIDRGR